MSLELFGCKVAKSKGLPAKLRNIVSQLSPAKGAKNGNSEEPLIFARENGSVVKPRLVIDPQNLNHCLIFHEEATLSSPQQLQHLGLSPRESEIAFWIFQRKTTWEMGKILQVSPRTVEKHVENIFSKLEVNNRDDLVTRVRLMCGM